MNTTQHLFKLIVRLQIALCIVFDRTVAVAVIRVGESVESALSALAAIFWLLARILKKVDKKYCSLTCRDKRESYLIVLQQNSILVC